MAKSADNIDILANRICQEVQALLPTAFERNAARQALQKNIRQLLQDYSLYNAPTDSRRVTILLSDIRGFTALAETYSALTLMELLNRYFTAMSDVIVRHGGTIDKLMGDSIMVLFGAPRRAEDDVERAIACAVEMQQAMVAFNDESFGLGLPEVYMGIGINTGTVIAGKVGSDYHSEYTVIGDQVNLACRIEAQSLRGQILISENTYQLARDYVLVGEPNTVAVKGKREPVCLYELMGTSKPRAMTVPRRETRRSPRVSAKMPCMFQRIHGKQVLPGEFHAEVVDISYNGLLINSHLPLELYSEIRIKLSLSLLSPETTDIYARVIHCEALDQGVQCSVEFTSIDMQGQLIIKHFVDSQVPGS